MLDQMSHGEGRNKNLLNESDHLQIAIGVNSE